MNQTYRAAVAAWLDRHWEEILTDIETLVRIPSVAVYNDPDTPFGNECRQALETALLLAQKYGFETENYENQCGSITLRPSDHEIGFWGHLDVVPAGNGWTLTSPFEPLRTDDYLFGRGSDDNKGPLVGVMHLLRAFEELRIPTRHGLRLYMGCDEEKGMHDAIWFAQNRKPADLNLIPDCGFPVCYGEKGILTLSLVSDLPMTSIRALQGGKASNMVPDEAEIRLSGVCTEKDSGRVQRTVRDQCTCIHAHGVPAHSAYPQRGINAINLAMQDACDTGLLASQDVQALHFLSEVTQDYLGTRLGIAGEDALSGITTCVGSMMHLDDRMRIWLHLNIRYSITRDGKALIAEIESSAREQGFHLEEVQDSTPHYFPREAPIVDRLTHVYNEITGENRQPYIMGGGTYARKLPNALGFGLGGMPRDEHLFEPGHGGAHQADEGLYLPNYRKALEIFAMGILEADAVWPVPEAGT